MAEEIYIEDYAFDCLDGYYPKVGREYYLNNQLVHSSECAYSAYQDIFNLLGEPVTFIFMSTRDTPCIMSTENSKHTIIKNALIRDNNTDYEYILNNKNIITTKDSDNAMHIILKNLGINAKITYFKHNNIKTVYS
jgi:hypothetical protein